MEVKREIYEVHLAYVNENGFHASDPKIGNTQYPIVIDSKNNNNDIDVTLRKAKGYLGDAEKYMSTHTEHEIDYAYIIRVSDGVQIEKRLFGKLKDLPDPEPDEDEGEVTPEGGEG